MDNKKAVFTMLGILFLGVIISIILIFLDTNLPVILVLALGVIYTIIIDLILVDKKPKTPKPKYKNNKLDSMYNDLLKNSIDLNEKVDELKKEEEKLKNLVKETKKTINYTKNIKKPIKHRKKYVASMNSKRFHDKHCKFSKLISNKNKLQFTTKTQALRQGFKPCEQLLNGSFKR